MNSKLLAALTVAMLCLTPCAFAGHRYHRHRHYQTVCVQVSVPAVHYVQTNYDPHPIKTAIANVISPVHSQCGCTGCGESKCVPPLAKPDSQPMPAKK